MSSIQEESFESTPTAFVRGSKLRKSFRIRQRFNPKLPPAAVLFMKSLEKNKVNTFAPRRCKQELSRSRNGSSRSKRDPVEVSLSFNLEGDERPEDIADCSLSDVFDPLADEEQLLIKNSPKLKRRGSFKKLSGKKLQISKLLRFFKK